MIYEPNLKEKSACVYEGTICMATEEMHYFIHHQASREERRKSIS